MEPTPENRVTLSWGWTVTAVLLPLLCLAGTELPEGHWLHGCGDAAGIGCGVLLVAGAVLGSIHR
jgi:hypothetical protein